MSHVNRPLRIYTEVEKISIFRDRVFRPHSTEKYYLKTAWNVFLFVWELDIYLKPYNLGRQRNLRHKQSGISDWTYYAISLQNLNARQIWNVIEISDIIQIPDHKR